MDRGVALNLDADHDFLAQLPTEVMFEVVDGGGETVEADRPALVVVDG